MSFVEMSTFDKMDLLWFCVNLVTRRLDRLDCKFDDSRHAFTDH